MRATKRKGRLPPFIPMIRTTMSHPTWKQLSYGARCLYHVLRGFLRVDNVNNGHLYRSFRDVHADLGRGTDWSIMHWFKELEHYGFIVQTSPGQLGVDGCGLAPHWRLTECPSFDGARNLRAATRDFEKWDGCLYVRPSKKTESHCPRGSEALPLGQYTATPEISQFSENHCPRGSIVEPPNHYPRGSITVYHSLAAPKDDVEGYSNPGLVAHALDVVNGELDKIGKFCEQETLQ